MKMNIYEENSRSQIISQKKNKEVCNKVIKELNEKYESNFHELNLQFKELSSNTALILV